MYVDDMLVAGELSDLVRVKQQLAQSFNQERPWDCTTSLVSSFIEMSMAFD